MYIEFRLPQIPEENGHGALFAIDCINHDMKKWVEKHDIQYFKTKVHKYTYRLVLKDDAAYSHFALTWNPKWAASRHFSFKQPK